MEQFQLNILEKLQKHISTTARDLIVSNMVLLRIRHFKISKIKLVNIVPVKLCDINYNIMKSEYNSLHKIKVVEYKLRVII